jgi:O-acetylhomoserine/O-acetylserine sulfhydrylase-like pyridoxal-dependent enzyme
LEARDRALDMLRRPSDRLEGLAELSALAEALGDSHLELDVRLRRAAALRTAEEYDRAAQLAREVRQLAAERESKAEPHGGGLVSIELKDNTTQGAFRFMNALRLCVRSTSLGDVFTSVLHPTSAFLRDVTPARRRELGVSDGLVRISVGIQKAEDIVADIEQALG